MNRLLARDPEAEKLARSERVLVCFGDGLGAGVISGEVAIFDAEQGDVLIAPRFAHLLSHHQDRLGDGCAAGLVAAQRSEVKAAALEARLRQILGLPARSAEPDAELDYLKRCTEP